MLKAAVIVSGLVASVLIVGSAQAGRTAADHNSLASLSGVAAKPGKLKASMRPGYRKVADSSQCEGTTAPVVACTCLALDSNGECLQQSCEMICDGKD